MFYRYAVILSKIGLTVSLNYFLESGIIADISLGVDECIDNLQTNIHWPLEKSNSQHSSGSGKSNTTTPTQSDDTQVTLYHVPDDIPVNI